MARISELDVQSGFSYIETGEGRAIYFHRSSVVGKRLRFTYLGRGGYRMEFNPILTAQELAADDALPWCSPARAL